ncbi:PrpF domain-containing protein [Paramicrobacterium fandaimingii]|uniref:PrpF domain-containing protein n=1 Tax=Paramicrobacterium fandaimingii TaxID=2708079 RepID=UPI001423C2B5|nr:PrpF domain-containing protein [Microbacterium fandaimingii]
MRPASGIPCMLMRGGTSKGAYFLAADLPDDADERADLMLRVMGSPDPTQIDGLGGAHPLTSKVAIISPSTEPGIDIDYLFLQIAVDSRQVGTTQTCGNLLAGVGPFAVERGLVAPSASEAAVRIRLMNTGDTATAVFPVQNGLPMYDGDASIDGVPGSAAAIEIEMTGGSRPLLPTGNVSDMVGGHRATLIDNGMPTALVAADELGIVGDESPADLESHSDLAAAVERIRVLAGALMGLGDVSGQTVPKVVLLSPPRLGGAIATRAFIPTRVHTSIGVLMAASVAAGVSIPGAVGESLAVHSDADAILIEHPSGTFPARVSVNTDDLGTWHARSMSLRTARKIFDGTVFPRPHP